VRPLQNSREPMHSRRTVKIRNGGKKQPAAIAQIGVHNAYSLETSLRTKHEL
jgi:hypothetical protein